MDKELQDLLNNARASGANEQQMQGIVDAYKQKKKSSLNSGTGNPTDVADQPISKLAVGSNGQLQASAPITSQSFVSKPADVFNPLPQKPTVTTNDGTAFPVDDVVANNFVQTKNTKFDVDALQSRVSNKTVTDEDVAVLAKSSGKSFDATKAYIHGGQLLGGSVDNMENVNAAKTKLANYITDYNTIYGTQYDPNDVLSTSQKTADFLDTVKSKKAVPSAQPIEGRAISSSTRIANNLQDIAALLPLDISNDMIKQIVSSTVIEDKAAGVPKDETINKIAKRINPKEYAKITKVQNKSTPLLESTPAQLIGDLFRDNAGQNELFNYQKGIAEITYNQAAKQNAINKISEGVLKGDQEAVSAGQHDLSQVDENAMYKYPSLVKQQIAQRVNDEIAKDSGVVEGYDTQDGSRVTRAFGASTSARMDAMQRLGILDDPRTKDIALEMVGNSKYFANNSIAGGVVQSFLQPFSDLGMSVADIVGLRGKQDIVADKIKDELFQQDFSQNVEGQLQLKKDVKVARNVLNTTANLAGMLAISTATEGVAGALGASASVAQKLGAYTSFGLPSFDASLKDSKNFLESTPEQYLYATINSIANAEGGRLLDLGKVTRIPGVSEDFAKLAKGLSENSITESAARELLDGAKNKYVDFAVKYGKNVTKGAATMAYFTTANNIIKLGFGDPNVEGTDILPQAGHAFLDGVLGMSIMGGFGAAADMRTEKNTTYKGTIYNLALNHDAAKDVFDLALQSGEYNKAQHENKIAILNTAVDAKSFLDAQEAQSGVSLTPDQKAVYVGNTTAEGFLRTKAANATLPEDKAKYEKQAEQLKTQSNQILEGLKFNENLEPLQNQFEAGKEYDVALENFNPDVPETVEVLESAKNKLDAASNTKLSEPIAGLDTQGVPIDNAMPDITVGEMLDKQGVYNGQRGVFSQDGQSVIFKVEGQNKEYELGNINEIKDAAISDFGISHEKSVVGIDDAGNIKVRDESYVNNFSDPLQAINRDGDGNIISVNLETTKGEKRTFKKNIAEDVAYQIHLKEITKDNETRTAFETFINEDPAAQEQINNTAVSTTAKEVASTPNGEISREKITPTVVEESSNIKIEESENKSIQNEPVVTETNTENKQGDIKAEAAQLTGTAVSKNTQPTETLTAKEQVVVDAIKEREFTGSIKNWTDVLQSETSTPAEKKQALKELTEQLIDPNSEDAMGAALGQKASDAIYDLEDKNSTAKNNGSINLPPVVEDTSAASNPESESVGITHAEIAKTRKELGLPEYGGKETETHKQLLETAQELIKGGYNLNKIFDKVKNSEPTSNVENAIMAEYKAALDVEMAKNPTKATLKKLTDFAKISDEAGTALGKGLESRKILKTLSEADTLANFLVLRERDKGVPLNDAQIKEQSAKFDELKKAKDELAAELKIEQDKNAALIAEYGLNKAKAIASKQSKKTKEEYKTERQDLVKSIRDKWKNAGKDTLSSDIPFRQQLGAIAPDVKKYVESLVTEGINKLDDIVSYIHADIKDVIDGISKKDIMDIIGGVHDEKRQTDNEKNADLRLLKREAELLNTLQRERLGEEKAKNEIQRTEKTRRIQDLENKIKEVRQQQKERGIEAEPVRDNTATGEQNKVVQKRLTSKIEKLQNDLKERNFAPEVKKPDTLAYSRKTQLLQDKVIQLENKITEERYKDERAKMSKWEKAWDKFQNVAGIRRVVQTAIDASIWFRQLGSIALNPRKWDIAKKFIVSGANSAFSQTNYDRYMNAIHKAEDFKETLEDGIRYNELNAVHPSQQNEFYPRSFVYKIPIVKQLLTASQRIANSSLNVARYELYSKYKSRLIKQGITRDSDPEMYKAMAKVVMNSTGSGNLLSMLENHKAEKVLGSLFYGARLMAANFNVLNPAYYAKLPKEVRNEAMKDLASYTTTMIVTGLAMAAAGGKISLNPDESGFLQVRFGDKVYDLTGGKAAYIRTFLRLVEAGYARATKTKYESNKSTEFGAKSVLGFFRNKLSPNTSYAINAFTGTNSIGQPFDPYEALKIYPMYADDAIKAAKEDGYTSLLTVLLPNIIGVGYGNYYSEPAMKPIEETLQRNLRSDEINKETIKDYNREGAAISDKQFQTYIEKRDAAIEKGIRDLYEGTAPENMVLDENNEVVTKKYNKLSKEQIIEATSAIKRRATNEVKEELFGKKETNSEDKKAKKELSKARKESIDE